LTGHVGKDPDIRNTQDGRKIANLTIATSETWNDKASGEKKERTEWHRVVVFNDRTADVVDRYVKKGALISVQGSLQTRKWTDQQGQERYTTEIAVGPYRGELTMLGGRDGGSRSDDRDGGDRGRDDRRGGDNRRDDRRSDDRRAPSNSDNRGSSARSGGGDSRDSGSRSSGSSWDSGGGGRSPGGGRGGLHGPAGGDLDDEIPFACCKD
jgi:single-strand DNA-binding protein